MGETEEFNTLAFEKRLMTLKDTQESIQSLSSWCLKQRAHHKKIVISWLNVLKRVKMEQRLVLFYLANDVIQYSKRKNYEFVESWGLNLQKATPLVRDEKVRPKILRIFKIWEERSVYDDEFLTDLTGLLSAGGTKKTDDDPLDFQPQQLVNKIKQCAVLEADTDLRLKYIHNSHLELSDADALCTSLKDRSSTDDIEKELAEGIGCVERYTQALQREIVAREALLALLATANQYYSTQRGEVKVVAYAYKNFGARVRALKRKLDELIPNLPNAVPSPPHRDEEVPSPGPDEDLDLPNNSENNDEGDDIAYNIDRTFNSSVGPDGSLYNMGLSSFLTAGDNPMALFSDNDINLNTSSNKIEVINNRPSEKQDFNINEFLKTLQSDSNPPNLDNSVVSVAVSQKSQEALPGLDLLADTGHPPPPTSFYGSINTNEDADQPYVPESADAWGGNAWSMPPPRVSVDTPESPPPAPASRRVPLTLPQEPPALDVDHRGLLPPPPPPPVLPILGHIEDVDHRLLPALPPPPLPVAPPAALALPQDVDHRNLISLTQRPLVPPQALHPKGIDQGYTPRTMSNRSTIEDLECFANFPEIKDYRVPPVMAPTDIVESVDMDLSDDEDQQGMYPSQQQNEVPRRQSFNNNKVLVGGDNGKTNHKESLPTPPIHPPMTNPFDSMPPGLKFNLPFEKMDYKTIDLRDDASDKFEEDMRRDVETRRSDFPDFSNDADWQPSEPRPFMNQRFPRNWSPRTNFNPQFRPQSSPQFRPRNGPRPPRNWGPRPQRFW